MYKLNEEEMFYDIADGQAVVINFITGMYYGTTMLGSEVLDRLLKGYAPEAVSEAVKALPGCPDDFDERLEKFVEELKDKAILVAGDTVPGGNEPIEEKTISEGFGLVLDEFAEVQDLILADPIHDVDVEQGWPVFREEEK